MVSNKNIVSIWGVNAFKHIKSATEVDNSWESGVMKGQIKHIHTVYLTHSATFISYDVKKRSQVILTIQAQGRQGAGGRGWGWWAGTGWQLAQTPTSSSTLTPPRQPPHPIRFIAGQTFQFLSRMITVRDPSPFPPAFLLLHPCSHPLLWTLTWNEKNKDWGQSTGVYDIQTQRR